MKTNEKLQFSLVYIQEFIFIDAFSFKHDNAIKASENLMETNEKFQFNLIYIQEVKQ